MRDPAGRTFLGLATDDGPQGCGGEKTEMNSISGMIGIDVSKKDLACALGDASNHQISWECSVPRTPAGVKKLLEHTPAGVPWVIEPTGRYSLMVAKEARQVGQEVLMAPPRKAKAFLASLPQRMKSDRLDGRGLALFGLTRAISQPLMPYPVKGEKVEQLDQLLSARKGLSHTLSKLKQQQRELPYAAAALSVPVAHLEEDLKSLDKQIVAQTKAEDGFPVARELEAIPGIGAITSAAVAARLEAKNFSHPDQFVAYIGLDPVASESGEKKGRHRLSKQGDAELRRLLYVCAVASMRAKDSPFQDQYKRELEKGLPKIAALCAVARKMARVCWSLHHHKTSYNTERVYHQPPSQPRDGLASGLEGEPVKH